MRAAFITGQDGSYLAELIAEMVARAVARMMTAPPVHPVATAPTLEISDIPTKNPPTE